jgi:D-alanine-D-alanine ligase
MKNKLKIAVLMGGVSNERAVSLKTGKAITEALNQIGHEAVPVDVQERNLDVLDDIAPDVVFVALHGEWGEDGQVQQMLEDKGIPYTGSGPEASRMGMDKVATKRAFIRHSVPTADYFVVKRQHDAARVAQQAAVFGYPLVCKPACGGSSIGVSIVRAPKELPAALDAAFAAPTEKEALLERYVRGREFTIGVLDGKALPVVEVVPHREFFDYEAKYSAPDTEYIIPVTLLGSTCRKMQEAAVRAYHALGCRHFARVDAICGADANLYILEVNTIPGFTPRSLLPMAARHAGIDFPDLCDRIVRMAMATEKAEAKIRDIASREQRRHTA